MNFLNTPEHFLNKLHFIINWDYDRKHHYFQPLTIKVIPNSISATPPQFITPTSIRKHLLTELRDEISIERNDEVIACGTPIVSFKVGGVPDTARPSATGYLAEPENVQDFINGIVQLLGDDSGRIRMSRQCREIALKEYSLKLWVERHIELYKNLLKR